MTRLDRRVRQTPLALPVSILLSLSLGGCGSSSRSPSSSVESLGPTNPSPSAPSSDPQHTGIDDTVPHATLVGNITRVDGTTANLSGITVAAFQATNTSSPPASPVASTTTDAAGHFSLDVHPTIEVELEVGGDSTSRITISAPGSGERVELRCHVVSGRLTEHALAGDADRSEVECHLSSLTASSSISARAIVDRRGGTTSTSLEVTHAAPNTALDLMSRPSADPLAPFSLVEHLTTDALGAATIAVSASIDAHDLELRDAAGTSLAAGTLARLPSSTAELTDRRHGETVIDGAGGVHIEVEAETDDLDDRCDFRISGLTPGQTIDLRMEDRAGSATLVSVATAIADDKGRCRIRIGNGGTAFPANATHATDLARRRMELHASATSLATGEMPEISPDF